MAQTSGTCFYCDKTYKKGGMTRHLKACKARQAAIEKELSGRAKPKKVFHLVVEGLYIPEYWLHLEIPENAQLSKLDQYLRNIWLECCGHLSMFDINDQRYSVRPMVEYGDKSMSARAGSVLSEDLTFRHEYDFGTTTHLELRVVDVRDGVMPSTIREMAQNDEPEIICQKCEKRPATEVCSYCIWGGEEAWLCETCKTQHQCYIDEGEDYMFLPVVNSPRVGMCGYTG